MAETTTEILLNSFDYEPTKQLETTTAQTSTTKTNVAAAQAFLKDLKKSTADTLKTVQDPRKVYATVYTDYLRTPITFVNLILLAAIMSIVSVKLNYKKQNNYEFVVLISSILGMFLVLFKANIFAVFFCIVLCLIFSTISYMQNKELKEKDEKYNELLIGCISLSVIFLVINILVY